MKLRFRLVHVADQAAAQCTGSGPDPRVGRVVTVVVADAAPGATLADFLAAAHSVGLVGAPSGRLPQIGVDGRCVPLLALLGTPPLLDTAYLHVTTPDPDALDARARPPASGSGLLQLHVVRGPDAGFVAELGAGEHIIGRGHEATVRLTDPTMSRAHAELSVSSAGVTLLDRGSTNGSTAAVAPGHAQLTIPIGAEFSCGNSVFTVRTPSGMPAATRPDGVGHLVLTPPPPSLQRTPRPPIEYPPAPTPTPPPKLSILGIVLPLVLGAALSVALRNATVLAFGLMGPVLTLGTWWSDRRSARRTDASAAAQHAVATERADTRVTQELEDERVARLAEDPDPASLCSRSRGPQSTLWDRTGATPARVRLGVGEVPAQTRVVGSPDVTVRAPVLLDIGQPSTTTIVGDRGLTRALARSIVIGSITRFAPHDLAVLTASDTADEWAWLTWAPHADDKAEAARTLTIIDGDAVAPSGDARPGHTVVLVGSHADLPTATTCRIDVGVDIAGKALMTTNDGTVTRFDPDLISRSVAARVADALAALRSASTASDGSQLPERVTLADVLDAQAPGAALDLGARWRAAPRSTVFTIGARRPGPDGLVQLDLAVDGPHVLVGGTTGSGKSEFLTTMVASLAAANRPDELCFVLIDYKGGAAFGACRDLPHVVGFVTDLDPAESARAIASLTAELKRRERLLADRGCGDLTAYQRVCREGDPKIPRLVIVIDEFRTLADEFPLLMTGLVRIAAQGRSLGVHLVVATQRPGGAVTADMRANLGLRIALRMRDTIDSLDVIDSPAAASLPASTPGRAIITSAARGSLAVQTAYANAPVRDASTPPVSIVSVDGVALPPLVPSSSALQQTELDALVTATQRAAAELAITIPRSPWLAPLPQAVSVTTLPPVSEPGAICLGLADDPDQQSQFGWEWSPAAGSLAICGGARSGKTTALRTVAAQLTTRFRPDELHVYVVHCGSLADLAVLPHCGAAVGSDEPARLARLIAKLTRGDGSIPSVLLLDDWDRVSEAIGAAHPRLREELSGVLRRGCPGMTVVATGGRALITGTISPAFSRRLLLLPADPVDLTMAGVKPGSAPPDPPVGRAIDPANGLLLQIARSEPFLAPPEVAIFDGVPMGGPERVPRLPMTVTSAEFGAPLAFATDGQDGVGFRPGIDDRRIVIIGEAGSGRSTALAALAASLRAMGRPVTVIDARRAVHRPTELDALVALRQREPRLAVLVDNAAYLTGTAWEDVLLEIARLVDEDDGVIAVTTSPAEATTSPRSLTATLLKHETGVLLGRLDPGAERLLGVRRPLITEAIPGRGYLVRRGQPTAIQVAQVVT
ncbi:MAG: FtsK/SpoIIIE domain-containing protein [Dermatophilaceae bacterium]